MPQPPLSRHEFTDVLQSKKERYWHRHAFHQRLHDGSHSEREIRIWVANRWYYQQALPCKDAAILANCPLPEVRRQWIGRILYQDGTAETEGGLNAWLRLAEATGLSKTEVLDRRHVTAGVRFATDAYLNFAQTRPWTEAVAASLTELFSADLMRERVAAMRQHYPWIDPRGYGYFESRSSEAEQDSRVALELVLEHCRTRAEQEAAEQALVFKCDVLWAMLDAIQQATSER